MKKFSDTHDEAETDAPDSKEPADSREGAIPPPREDADRRADAKREAGEGDRESEGAIPSPREDKDKRRTEASDYVDNALRQDWSFDSLKNHIKRYDFEEVRGKVGILYSSEYKPKDDQGKDLLHPSMQDKISLNAKGNFDAYRVAHINRDAYPDTSIMLQDTKIGKMLETIERKGWFTKPEMNELWGEASEAFAKAVRDKGAGNVAWVRESKPEGVFQKNEFPQLRTSESPVISDEPLASDHKPGKFENIPARFLDEEGRWPGKPGPRSGGRDDLQ